MDPRLPSNVIGAATRAAFGHRTGVFRTLRGIPTGVAWLIVVGAAVVAVFAVVAGAVAVGLSVVPIVLLLMAAYRYLLPPAGGRRWLATYEHGFIETAATQARMARWSDVVGAQLAPYPIEAFALSLNPDPDGIADQELPPIQVPLAGLVPRAELIDVVEQQVPGTIPFARREGWHQQARRSGTVVVALCALMVVPVLAAAVQGGDVRSLPQSATPSSPAAPTTSYSFYVAGPESTPTDQPTTVDVPAPSPEPGPGPSTVTTLPKSTYDYGDVCTGTTFAAAPAYGAPAPHYVFIDLGDAFFSSPEEWGSSDPAKIQLVACVVVSTGEQLRTCKYSGDDGVVISQKLLRTRWDITVRETRTGGVVGHTNFAGGNTQCDDFITTFGGIADKIQHTEPTSKQLQDAIGKYVQR